MADGHPNESESPPGYDNFLFSASGKLAENNDELVEKLDDLEIHIERLRNDASALLEQKEALTNALTEISSATDRAELTAGHKEELNATLERLMMRILAVQIIVNIPRSAEQEKAYETVKKVLDELKAKVNIGLQDYKSLLESYINACSPEPNGIVDQRFQDMILACTVDDQKTVRKLLSNWLKIFTTLHGQWMESTTKLS